MKTLCKAGARITALAAVFVALFGGCTDIYIRDAALSSNALLARLSVKHGETELAPGFQPEVFEYTGAVLYPVETLTISAECADSKAALSYSANVADGIVTLARGANCVVVTVTAENGAVQEYVAHINVISSNALLARLSVQNGETELTPGFQPDVFEYANTVLYPVETLTISAECADSGAMLSYSANVADGIVTLARGAANRVVVTVTAEDGATQEYVVNINAAGPKWFDALAFEPSNNPGVSSFDMSFNEDAAVYTFTTL
ncbi:MAG: cadherin-like beta sandwich domain-containing protein, partial [Treponema sp.]|nr:cadherin-like beta sandwich domain-containing protein [Treponema sp.]